MKISEYIDQIGSHPLIQIQSYMCGWRIHIDKAILSVQCGGLHYCGDDGNTAEIAVIWFPDGFPEQWRAVSEDSVRGWQTSDDVSLLIESALSELGKINEDES